MRKRIQSRWITWLTRRMPVLEEVRLHRRNIFILPSKFGVVFAALNILLFVLGVNYQNNLVIMLSSFCFSLFMTTMLMCYQNMAGILIKPIANQEYVAQQLLSIQCYLMTSKTKHGITFNYKHEPSLFVSSIKEQQTISLALNKRQRGVCQLPRLIIGSQYPLGLFRAWANLEFEQEIVVFPAALAYVAKLSAIAQSDGAHSARRTFSGDSFSGLEPYREGESLKRVAWKQVAQGKGLLSKQFEQTLGEPQWLDISDIDATNVELKLSHLVYLVNYFASKNQPFGLRLGNQKLGVGQGNAHRFSALTLLANYGGHYD